ncbi:T-complex protein 1 subunit eta-like [Eurosta solidaginis]|uniref:T-complex protein 1 subunit eta-like n=1 Tax=Eurosta solidaginis TaxID=178769 RepID=UPI0035306FB8
MDLKSYKKYKIALLNIELELKAERVPEDLKRTMKYCGGAVMTTANDINSSVFGQCDYFEERQVGGERFNIFQGCVNARTCTLILRSGAEQFLEETELR